MIRWLPDFAIGVQDVDAEHQGLFTLAAKLHQSIKSNDNGEVLGRFLQELFDYTCYHFSHEEELMERIGYPHFAAHREQHDALRSQVVSMKERYASGESDMAQKMVDFVADWLKYHTTTSDRRIGTYMRKNGLL